MIIVWFFKYIKYRINYKERSYYLYRHSIPPLTLKQYFLFCKRFYKGFKYHDTDSTIHYLGGWYGITTIGKEKTNG